MTAPVQHTNVAPDLILGPGSTPTVDLTVSGRRNTIRTLKEQDVQVSVDLSGITFGRHLIKVSAKNIFLPFGVKIDRVAPQKIMVNLRQRRKDSEPGSDQPSTGL
jgi:YbbR domain-containing protein